MEKIKFTSTIERFNSDLWHFHLSVPNSIVSHFKQNNIKRFICELNNQELIHCAIMPAGENRYFININKALRKKLGLNEGSEVVCEIWEDTSKYGMPVPEEFEEVLNTDPEGLKFFEGLTPGKKRSLIHIVAKLKNSDKTH